MTRLRRSALRTSTAALVGAAALGLVATGCGSGTHPDNSRACTKFATEYRDVSSSITKNTSPYMQLGNMADDLQIDADFIGVDADNYASGRVETRMRQFQHGLQKVVDTARDGKLDLSPMDVPLRQVDAACGLSLAVPTVTATP